jgi:hypothetical protein
MAKLSRIGIVILCSILLVGDGGAVTGDLKKDPSEMLEKYLSLDLKGARLDPMLWETLKPYINWKEEPVWRHAVVVAGYRVIGDTTQWQVVNPLEVLIPVEFRVLGGMYWDSAGFVPEVHVEEVRYRIRAVKDRWRIIEPMLPPHVGQKWIINYVRQAMLQETDPERLAVLTSLRDDLAGAKSEAR